MLGCWPRPKVLAFLALLCSAAASGCGERDSGRVTIDFWAMGREGEVVQELTREFERLHPEHPGPRAADPVERRA